MFLNTVTAAYDHYQDGNWWCTEYPRVYEHFEIDEEHRVNFILADEAQVKLINPPRPELVGAEGKWGELKKKLHSATVVESANFTLEIIGNGYYWLCVLSQIEDGVNELKGKISRRNRLIEDLRAKLTKLRIARIGGGG